MVALVAFISLTCGVDVDHEATLGGIRRFDNHLEYLLAVSAHRNEDQMVGKLSQIILKKEIGVKFVRERVVISTKY